MGMCPLHRPLHQISEVFSKWVYLTGQVGLHEARQHFVFLLIVVIDNNQVVIAVVLK